MESYVAETINHFLSQNDHGAPGSSIRHVGDLGNIVTPASGPTAVSITDSFVSLVPGDASSVLNRAVVVHAGEDDLGVGGPGTESARTGNAGARLACGIIRLF